MMAWDGNTIVSYRHSVAPSMNAGQSGETVLAHLRPSRLLSFHYYLVIFAIMAGIVSTSLGYFPGTLVSPGLRTEFSLMLSGMAFFLYLLSEFRRISHRYTIYDYRVGVAEGILRKRVQYMPFTRVERVEINQSLIGRLFGIGKVIIDTGDDHVVLHAIRSPAKVERLISGQIRRQGASRSFPRQPWQP